MKNINIYWDHGRGIVGIVFLRDETRYEEPINGRASLTDSDLVRMIDLALGNAEVQ